MGPPATLCRTEEVFSGDVVLDLYPVRIGSFSMFGPAVQIYTATHPLEGELRRRVELGKPVVLVVRR